ncbi:hypothetical protein SAMN04515671_2183 [Nakamurella panacisegetis]|uniref:Barstar (Barnase inhibitor) n=1 Tax=Nakamurella panacisegetis TaxID=1090615 RepID=A0A1H0N362_9ACTN|nr:hypothetical protein [Nakamurella panacisegetis]SDO87164.1 hypothetical protein SAMN04515671_2183 [Nakamurella panacisegetis]
MTSFPLALTDLTTLVDDRIYESQWRPQLDRAGVYLLEIDVRHVSRREDFFDCAATGLGLGPDERLRKWSGLEDRIWGALAEHPADSGALVLRHADAMAGPALGDLLQAVGVFTDLAKAVGPGHEGSFPRDVQLFVILTGSGDSFPP